MRRSGHEVTKQTATLFDRFWMCLGGNRICRRLFCFVEPFDILGTVEAMVAVLAVTALANCDV